MTSASPSAAGQATSTLPEGFPPSLDPVSLFAASPAAVSVHEGAEHRYVFTNDAHDAFGPRGAIGLTLREALPDLAAADHAGFDRVFATGEAETQPAVKTILTDAAGQTQIRWHRRSLQPWRRHDGVIGGVVCHAHDVTDQLEALEALRQRTAELEFALDVAGGVGSWDWDVAADRVTVNERLAMLFGLSAQEAQSLPLARFVESILPEDRPQVAAAIAAAVEACGDYVQDYRVRTSAGEIRWVTARGRCFCDDEGRPSRFPGVVFDVTRQVEERQQGEHTFAILKSILDNSATYVFAKDMAGRYILANNFYLQAFGETEASLYGRTDRERFGPDEPYSLNDRRVAASGTAIEFEEQAVRADGEMVHAISVKFPLRDSQGVMFGTGSISTDVTDRRRAEAALAASEERLRYMNRELNHRVKNLFAVTRGMIRMMAREEPVAAAFAQRAIARIDALAAAHSIGLETEGTEPVGLAELLGAILRPFAQAGSERIRLAGPPVAIPRRIVTPLTLTIYELATNAFKHGSLARAEGALAVSWAASPEGGEGALLEIRWSEDCGAPLPPAESGRTGGGFGQRLIDASVTQMNGTFVSERTATGLRLAFTIPLAVTG